MGMNGESEKTDTITLILVVSGEEYESKHKKPSIHLFKNSDKQKLSSTVYILLLFSASE